MANDLTLLRRQRGTIKRQLTLFHNFLHPIQEAFDNNEAIQEKTITQLQDRTKLFETLLNAYETIQSNIECTCNEDILEQEYVDRDQFTNSFAEARASAKTILRCTEDFNWTHDMNNRDDAASVADNTAVSAAASVEASHASIIAASHGASRTASHAVSRAESHAASHAASRAASHVESRAASRAKSHTASHAECHASPQQLMDELNHHLRIKLPTINIPNFKGHYGAWLEFKETFESLIHNNNTISDIQKYHYLRTSLQGDARNSIRKLEFSTRNYQTAWDLLCKRYDNSRLLVHSHVKALFELESIAKESSLSLRNLIDATYQHLESLEALQQPVHEWDTLIIYLITTKLDKTTIKEWEEQRELNVLPTLSDLEKFLLGRAELLETMEIKYSKHNKEQVLRYSNGKRNNISQCYVTTAESNYKCYTCKGSHSIYTCPDFLSLSINARIDKVNQLGLCSNCLRTGHKSEQCKRGNCRSCKQKHNSLLHKVYEATVTTTTSNQDQQTVTNLAVFPNINSQVLLPTAIVHITGFNGIKHPCRVMLDSGAQANLITEKFCNQLQLPTIAEKLSIFGINQIESTLTNKCNVTLSSLINKYTTLLSCHIIQTISGNVPMYPIRVPLRIPDGIKLSDEQFLESKPVDMLIGSGLFWDLMVSGKIDLGKGLPVLKNTKLGWVVAGNAPMYADHFSTCNFIQASYTQEDEQLKRFWQIEEAPSNSSLMTNEEAECEALFTKDTSRDHDGRFVVKFPLKHPPSLLGESLETAKRRFLALEKRFNKNQKFKSFYQDFIAEYISLGHMSRVIPTASNTNEIPTYYLPHHGVVKDEDQLMSKFRVVFDGSSSTSTGWSLNQIQYIGPKVQNDIHSILLRFRKHTYVVSSDVSKMYRQIIMHPEHRPLQRIIWRDDPSKEFSILQLNTVTYGTSSAPYLAIKCLKQVALDNMHKFPTAAQVILSDFYVDDLLTGADSIKQLNTACHEVSSILQSSGFMLRKWISNDPNALTNLNPGNVSNGILTLGEHESSKILGIQWASHSDTLTFSIHPFKVTEPLTKRKVLANIAQLYDPLGLISPCIILAKILIQKLWCLKLSWDEPMPNQLAKQWNQFRVELTTLNRIQIPRNAIGSHSVLYDIHCFCDASQDGYAACVYLRGQNSIGDFTVNLLCSKTKVAPIKTITSPRLELCAALLGSQLINHVIKSLNISVPIYIWSDSQITLCWIKTEPKLLQVFVANRVSKIQNLTNRNDWYYVNTKENPADIASRGVFPSKLVHSNLWWRGPEFLKGPTLQWPTNNINISLSELPELKNTTQVFPITNQSPINIFTKFSNLNKLKRVVAYCQRFIHNSRFKNNKQIGPVTADEMRAAMKQLVTIAQLTCYPEEINLLKSKLPLKSKSRLVTLSPFLDNDGLLRVGGRLKCSQLQYETKHPLLLDGKHPLTSLIIEHYHINLHHAPPQLLLATIRQEYWPTSGINSIKKIVRSCIKCFRFNPKNYTPQMANLPAQRVTAASPFKITGVDYAGPILIKNKKGPGCKLIKAYVCVFVCFATKSMHLELVSDLTTDNFIAAFRRFCSRRGKPTHVHSDNGSNFVGARGELSRLANFLTSSHDNISNFCTDEGITWHFIPPNSPHFGGLWEAGVKRVKYHLFRAIGDAKLTYEEFNTILTQIEAILNSRPICPLSSDPNDFESLTPSHFLIGRSMVTAPDPNVMDIPINRVSRYQLIQQVNQSFWKRWSKEYLTQLQQRNKWRSSTPNIVNGSMVILQIDNSPPCKWPLGRVVQLHPDNEGVVRVISVKTAKGIFKRAVAKVYPLPTI